MSENDANLDPVPDSDEWTEPATEEELRFLADDSRDFVDDDYEDEDEWYSGYPYDDEEEVEPTEHAVLEAFGDGKCHCPYCNSECAPDYCYACQSYLKLPPLEPETRNDLPDEPPF